MNIFVINRGSSSIKCYLYQFKNGTDTLASLLWEAHIQWKSGFENPTLTVKNIKGMCVSEKIKAKSAALSLEYLISLLTSGKTAVLNSFDEVKAIGHRIVHGGEYFTGSVLVTSDVKEKIGRLS